MADFAQSPPGAERVDEPRFATTSDRLRYEILVDGEVAGFVQYNMRGGRLILVHTEIDDAYARPGSRDATRRGRARRHPHAAACCIVPVCPFVERFIERHPEYDDLVDHEMFDALNAEKQ